MWRLGVHDAKLWAPQPGCEDTDNAQRNDRSVVNTARWPKQRHVPDWQHGLPMWPWSRKGGETVVHKYRLPSRCNFQFVRQPRNFITPHHSPLLPITKTPNLTHTSLSYLDRSKEPPFRACQFVPESTAPTTCHRRNTASPSSCLLWL